MKKALSLLLALTFVLALSAGVEAVIAAENPNGDYLVAKRSRPFLLGFGDAAGDAIGSDYATIGDYGWRTGRTKARWVVGESVEPNTDECLSMCLKSDVAEGEGPNNAPPTRTSRPILRSIRPLALSCSTSNHRPLLPI